MNDAELDKLRFDVRFLARDGQRLDMQLRRQRRASREALRAVARFLREIEDREIILTREGRAIPSHVASWSIREAMKIALKAAKEAQ